MKQVNQDFQDKVALVTGGTRGIGLAIANRLKGLGAQVIITGTSTRPEDFPDFNVMRLNFLDETSVQVFLEEIQSLPRIDILINNAGINRIQPIGDLCLDDFQDVHKVNLEGPLRLIQTVSKAMISNQFGRILNISSIWSVVGKEKRHSYAASKTGLVGLTRTLALDLGPYNILVNSLSPGFTLTELTSQSLSKQEMAELCAMVPLGRFAQVDEIAKCAAFLVSDQNTYMTGQNITVDGGFTIC